MTNTTQLFQPLPMSGYDEVSQPKIQMNNIQGVSLESLQQRIIPRQVTTGSNRGETTVRGSYRVVDTLGVPRVIIGYKKNAL